MGASIKVLSGCWMLSLLVASLLTAASGDLRLVEAVKMGNKEAVRSLLQNHFDVNVSQVDGATALAWAAYQDDLEMAELLIRSGADVNAANDYGVTPLSLACASRNAFMVEKLLMAEADPNAALWTGETVLMTCASTGNVEAVKLLLEQGAEVNAKEPRQGQTALMWAAAEKRLESVRTLIEHGADVQARSKFIPAREPFTMVCTLEHPCEYGGTTGNTYEPTVRFRSSTGGFTPLLFAAQQGDVDSAKLLLEAGADVNEATPEDGSALVVASASGHEGVALLLLEQGANPNAKNGYGITALHYALHEGMLTISSYRSRPTDRFGWLRPNMPVLVKALLAHGADPNARIEKDFPPYDYGLIARSNGNSLPQISLVGATPFFLAAASGDVGNMRSLVEGRADPRLATVEETTPLMVAAGIAHERRDRWSEEKEKSLQAVKLAVELGADVNSANIDGRTALHGAADMRAYAIVQFLAEKRANLEAKDKYGQTAMTIAMADPEGLVYRVLGNGQRDYSFREYGPRDVNEELAALLIKLGATPVVGTYRDLSGE